MYIKVIYLYGKISAFALYKNIYVRYLYLHSKYIFSYGKTIFVVKIIRLYSIKSK